MKTKNRIRQFEKTSLKEKRIRLYQRLGADESMVSERKTDNIFRYFTENDFSRFSDILLKAKDS